MRSTTLLKPFSDERFEAALQRARYYIRTQSVGKLGLRFARMLENQVVTREGSDYLERVLIRSAGRVTFPDVSDIDWIEAAGARSYLYRATVGQIQERLDPRAFRARSSLHHGQYQPDCGTTTADTWRLCRSGHRVEFESWLRQPL